MKKSYVYFAILLLIPLLFLWRIVFTGESLSGGDLVNHFIPIKFLTVEIITQGQFPHWNPLTFSGRPLQADIQTGVFYPPNILFLWLSPNRAFDILTILHFIFLSFGAFLFFRTLLENNISAFLSAAAFSFAGFFVTQLHSGIVLFIFAGAYLPWMLWAAEQGITERKFSGFLYLAFFGAMQLLAGAPQIAFYSWLLVGVYFLTAVGMEFRGRSTTLAFGIEKGGWMAILGMISAAILAAMLTAVQWMPTQEFLSQSFERAQGASWEYITDGSLRWDYLPTFLAPWLFGNPTNELAYWGSSVGFWEFNGYVGILPFVLAIVGLGSLGRHTPTAQLRLAVFALLCVLLWLFFAPGKYSPIFKAAYYLIPGFSKFRVPARWVLSYQLGIAALAGLGFHAVFIQRSQRSIVTLLVALCCLLILSIVIFLKSPSAAEFFLSVKGQSQLVVDALSNPNALQILQRHITGITTTAGYLVIIVLYLLLCVTLFSFRKETSLYYILILLTTTELCLFAANLVNSYPSRDYRNHFYPNTPLVEALQQSVPSGQRFTWDDSVFDWTVDQNQEEIYPNRPIMHDLSTVRGYDPMNSLRYGQFMNALGGLPLDQAPRAFMFMPYPYHPRLLAMLNTSTILSYQSLPVESFNPRQSFPFTRNLLSHQEPASLAFYSAEPPLGEAYLARPELLSYAQMADPPQVLARLTSPEFDWRHTALVEADELPNLVVSDSPKYKVELLQKTANSRTFSVSTNETAVLVLSESYYPGWRARVDGKIQPAFPANHALIGTFVDPGQHRVEFYYLPQPFLRGRIISAFGIALFLLLLLVARRQPHHAP